MPSIDVAMARSIRGAPLERLRDVFARSVVAGLTQRDTISNAEQKVTDIKTALSSWDNCMDVVWCKWPVIGIIVIGGLIIFSIVWCIIRCCCCGLSCCCSCCQCLKCCGDCCGCCDPPGGRKHKHLDDPYAPAPETNSHAYRSEPPMNPTFGQSDNTQFTPPTQHWQNEPPKYAEFEVRGAKHDDDALPEMPTMEKAEVTTKVGLHDDVELDQLKKSPVQEQQFGMMNGTPSTMPQGRSPYGQQQGNNSGYFNGQGQAPDSYSPIDHKGYGHQSNQVDGYGHDQYAMGAVGAPVGRHSPANNYDYNQSNGYDHNQNNGYDHNSGYHQGVDHGYDQSHGGYGGYNNTNQGYGTGQPPAPTRTPVPELNGYGYGVAPSRSPAPQSSLDDYHQSARKTPAIQDSYGYQSEQAYGNHRTFSPAPAEAHYGPRPVPQRQYPQQDAPRSPLNNNSGFDFNSGHSRPDPSPTTESYPGYKAYQP